LCWWIGWFIKVFHDEGLERRGDVTRQASTHSALVQLL
jgi:hypothetical protein